MNTCLKEVNVSYDQDLFSLRISKRNDEDMQQDISWREGSTSNINDALIATNEFKELLLVGLRIIDMFNNKQLVEHVITHKFTSDAYSFIPFECRANGVCGLNTNTGSIEVLDYGKLFYEFTESYQPIKSDAHCAIYKSFVEQH